MAKIKESLINFKYIKLEQYIAISILVTFMLLNIWSSEVMIHDIKCYYVMNTEIDYSNLSSKQIREIEKIKAQEKSVGEYASTYNETLFLNQTDSSVQETKLQMYSYNCVQTISLLIDSCICGILIGIVIYMYKNLKSILKLTLGYLIIIISAVFINKFVFFSMYIDFLGDKGLVIIPDAEFEMSMYILLLLVISLTIVKFIKDKFTTRKLNNLIKGDKES